MLNLDTIRGKITMNDRLYIRDLCRIASKQARQNIDKNMTSFLSNLEEKEMPPGNYYWITLNWDPKAFQMDLIKQKIDEILKYKYINYYWYNYEQRGKNLKTCGTGVHNHLLINIQAPKPPAPSVIRRFIYRKIKNLVGNNRHIDIRKTTYPSDKIHYLEGSKQGNTKDEMVKQDRKFREDNNLEGIYTNYEEK